jgi:hypothetical protein
MIGINFKGPTQAGTGVSVGDRTAGVEPQSNWNDLGYWESSSIKNDSGAVVANLSVNTSTSTDGYNSYATIPSDDGNRYLMRGYIRSSGASLTVTVSGLGPPFKTDNYDILVYFDGENGSADWVTQYTIGVDGTTIATVYGRDAKDTVQWDGTFVQSFGTSDADATAGNYIRFTGLTSSGFTLTATPVDGDGPINAIQIIGAPEPASASLLALGLASAFAARVRRCALRRRDA